MSGWDRPQLPPEELAARREAEAAPVASVPWGNLAGIEPEQPPEAELFGLVPLAGYSSVYGQASKGKSWLVAVLAIEAARLGHPVVVFDREASAGRFRRRLRKLGADEAAASLAWISTEAEAAAILPSWEAWQAEHPGAPAWLVLIDSLTTTGGSQDAEGFGDWHDLRVAPLIAAGLPVVAVDHDNKRLRDSETGARLSRGPSGAHEKLDRVQGVAVWVTGQPLRGAEQGNLRLTVDKDNDDRTRHEHYRLILTSDHAEGLAERIRYELRPEHDLDLLAETRPATDAEQRAYLLMDAAGEDGFTVGEIAEELGVTERYSREMIRGCPRAEKKLDASGLQVKRGKEHVWTTAQVGTS